jgi:thiamine-phosphate pyrophosphorylase
MKGMFDGSLYLVTDRRMIGGRPLAEVVEAAVRGGVTCVQLREKTCGTREFMEQADILLPVLRRRNVPLIINDRIDVALAVGADGVHLGQKDMPLAYARRIFGSDRIIGVSAESLEDALAAEEGGADYLGVSPIFATPTKTDTAPALGMEGLRRIRAAVKLPLVGIGGLNRDNAAEVIRNGADGVAVVSAIMAAADPETAARALAAEIRRNRTMEG